jgi:hypothetical protein
VRVSRIASSLSGGTTSYSFFFFCEQLQAIAVARGTNGAPMTLYWNLNSSSTTAGSRSIPFPSRPRRAVRRRRRGKRARRTAAAARRTRISSVAFTLHTSIFLFADPFLPRRGSATGELFRRRPRRPFGWWNGMSCCSFSFGFRRRIPLKETISGFRDDKWSARSSLFYCCGMAVLRDILIGSSDGLLT